QSFQEFLDQRLLLGRRELLARVGAVGGLLLRLLRSRCLVARVGAHVLRLSFGLPARSGGRLGGFRRLRLAGTALLLPGPTPFASGFLLTDFDDGVPAPEAQEAPFRLLDDLDLEAAPVRDAEFAHRRFDGQIDCLRLDFDVRHVSSFCAGSSSSSSAAASCDRWCCPTRPAWPVCRRWMRLEWAGRRS